MKRLELLSGRFSIIRNSLVPLQTSQVFFTLAGIDGQCLFKGHLACFVHEQSPNPAEKTIHSLHSLGVPWLGHLKRSHEHLIQAKGIGAISTDNVIRIDHIPP